MKKIKNYYTKFILTVIAVAMIGILFQDSIISKVEAKSYAGMHKRITNQIIASLEEDHGFILAACR